MIQMPSSTSPCYDLSTVFVANGLAPHTYSGVVTSLTPGVTQTCLSVAPAGSSHSQQPIQFIASSGAGTALIATNPGSGPGSGNPGVGRLYGGGNSGYGNNYYNSHYNAYPKPHGGDGRHHRMGGVNVPLNSNPNNPGKPYRGNKYGGGNYVPAYQQQQQHSAHPGYHYSPGPPMYHANSYVPNAVVPNSGRVPTEASSGNVSLGSNATSVASAMPPSCPPPPPVTVSSACTSNSASSTAAISNCVTPVSSKETTIAQSQKPPTSQYGKPAPSTVSHASTTHLPNQSLPAQAQSHHSGPLHPHFSTKSNSHPSIQAGAHKSSQDGSPEYGAKAAAPLVGKPNATLLTNGPDMEQRPVHINNFSSRPNTGGPLRTAGSRPFEPRERPPKSSGSGSGYRGKRDYTNNYSQPPATGAPGAVSEVDGNIIRKHERTERSGSGKFSRAPPNAGLGASKGASVPGSNALSSSSRPARNAAQSVNASAAEQPFNLLATAFPPLPGLNEAEGGEGKSGGESLTNNAASDAHVVPGHAAQVKSTESSLADVVKGHNASLQFNHTEERAVAFSEPLPSSQSIKPTKSLAAVASSAVNHVEPVNKPTVVTCSKGPHKSSISLAESVISNPKSVVQLETLPVVSSVQEPIVSSTPTNELQTAPPTSAAAIVAAAVAATQPVSNNSYDLMNHDSSGATTNILDYHSQVNHIGATAGGESSVSRSSSVSLNRNDSSLSDFPLDGLPGAPTVAASGQEASTFTYAQIARLKAAKSAAAAAAANSHENGPASLTSTSSEHSIGSTVAGASAVNHIHKDPHGATGNASLRTRSIVVCLSSCPCHNTFA